MGVEGKVPGYQCYPQLIQPKLSPLEDRLMTSLPGENMGPIQEEIRQ